MTSIKVIDGQLSVKLPVKGNKMSLKTFKTYFPHATSLIYMDKNEKCGLVVHNDEYELVPGITEYHVHNVHNANPLKEKNYNDAKRRKINDIMAVIDGREDEKSVAEDTPEYRITPKKVMKKKLLYIAWKHKESWNDRSYKQMKTPIGGIRKLELIESTDYSYEEIRELAINAMKNQYNQATFDNSAILLANNEEDVFNSFTTTKGKTCTFWEFSPQIKLKNSQLRLCLLTTALIQDDSVKVVSRESDATSEELSSNHHPQVPPQVSSQVSSQVSPQIPAQVSGSQIRFSLNREGSLRIITNSQDSKNEKKTDINQNQRDHAAQSNLSSQKQSAPPVDDYYGAVQLSVPIIDESEIQFTDTVLGRGAFGCVILSTWLGTDVAVKKLVACQKPKYLLREISVMDKIRHPNIISIMAVSSTDKYLYIVMEYFDSVSLRQFLRNPLVMLQYEERINKKAYISQQICRAVSYLHELNPSILHKDLKPENILIDKYLTIKICDLGLSKTSSMSASLQTTVGHNFHGTVWYMAPEILIHDEQGQAPSDIWSMACCIFEVFTEKRAWYINPYNLRDLRRLILHKKTPDLQKVPIELQGVLSACFQHNPIERPRACELLQVFNHFLKSKKKLCDNQSMYSQ